MPATRIAFLLLLASCGSRFDQGKKADVATVPESADAELGTCTVSEPPKELKSKGYKKIDVNKLALKGKDGRSKSFCSHLLDMDSLVGIIQFSGVTCLSCQDEAKYFTKSLGLEGPFGNPVLHSVALTDLMTDYTEQDFEKFMDTYAPHSLRLHDADTALWRHFSIDPNAPVRPTIVAFNAKGWAFIVNKEGAKPESVLKAAKALLEENADDLIVANDDEEEPSEPNPVPVPNPVPNPVPVPTPDPNTKPAVNLTAAKNVALSGGAAGETLATAFGNNDYMVIDLSQYNCTYCKQLANKHQADAAFQKAMTSGKCIAITVVPNADLSAWRNLYNVNTFVGKYTRGVVSESKLASAFAINFQGTPTVFVIDRQGTVVAQAVGAVPAKVQSLCY